MPDVDNAHSQIVDAIDAVNEIRLSELNETERELVLETMDKLYLTDAAMAERSSFPPTNDARVTHDG